MTGRTHDLAAFTLLTYIVITTPLPTMTLGTAIAAVVANLFGGITPDIDEPTAPFWRNLPVGGVVGRMFDALVGGHRFLLHSLLGLLAMGFLLHLFLIFLHPSWPSLNGDIVWWSFMIGYFSHLAMDTLTKEGVPWLLPIPWKIGLPPIKAWRITTGKLMETVVIFPGLLVIEMWLIVQHSTLILHLFHQLSR